MLESFPFGFLGFVLNDGKNKKSFVKKTPVDTQRINIKYYLGFEPIFSKFSFLPQIHFSFILNISSLSFGSERGVILDGIFPKVQYAHEGGD